MQLPQYVVYLIQMSSLLLGILALQALYAREASRAQLMLFASTWAIALAAFVFSYSDPSEMFFDFKKAYWEAGSLVLQGPSALAATFKEGTEGFVNIPIVAYVFAPFGLLDPATAAFVFTIIGLACVLMGLHLLGKAADLEQIGAARLLLIAATFGPLIYSIREGNTTHITLLMIAAALLSARYKQDVRAGLLLGLASVLKPPLLLFGFYYALKQRWRIVFGGTLVILVTAALSIAVFGLEMHLLWYNNSIRPYAQGTLSAMNVQSIDAALMRMALGPNVLWTFTPHKMGTVLDLISTGLTALIIGLAIAACMLPRPASARRADPQLADDLEFCTVLLVACVVSPLSWSHYYLWLLVPIAFIVSGSRDFLTSAMANKIAFAAILLAAPLINYWQPGHELLREVHARIASSHLLLGGLIILALLLWSRWHVRLRPAVETKSLADRGGASLGGDAQAN